MSNSTSTFTAASFRSPSPPRTPEDERDLRNGIITCLVVGILMMAVGALAYLASASQLPLSLAHLQWLDIGVDQSVFLGCLGIVWNVFWVNKWNGI